MAMLTLQLLKYCKALFVIFKIIVMPVWLMILLLNLKLIWVLGMSVFVMTGLMIIHLTKRFISIVYLILLKCIWIPTVNHQMALMLNGLLLLKKFLKMNLNVNILMLMKLILMMPVMVMLKAGTLKTA